MDNSNALKVDKILNATGAKPKLFFYFSLCWVIAFSTFTTSSFLFTARDVKYRCKIPDCDKNSTIFQPDWLKHAVPFTEEGPSKCLYYKSENSSCQSFSFTNETALCDEFIFDTDQITIVHDFNIKCDENLWKLTIIGTFSAIGGCVFLPIMGFLSDQFGRKVIIVSNVLFCSITGVLHSFSPDYYTFITLEVLNTALSAGMYNSAMILALEMVDTKKRNLANFILCLAFIAGELLLGIVAAFAKSWRTLLQILFVPGLLLTLLLFYIPESIRWLLQKNRVDEAFKVVLKLTKDYNKEDLRKDLVTLAHVERREQDKNVHVPIWKIFTMRTLLLRIVCCIYGWFSAFFIYYGFAVQSVNLSQDPYWTYSLTILAEIPGVCLNYFCMNKLGRKTIIVWSFLLTGIGCITAIFTEEESTWYNLVIYQSGKCFVGVAFIVMALATAEMVPTVWRNSILSLCMVFGNVGSTIAPQVPLLASIYKPLPMILFAFFGFSSGLFALILPETGNLNLPDQVHEALSI